jgi:predicted TIM-barrel fold metal-dependent hydrolase
LSKYDRDRRYFGTIEVAPREPRLAVAEIEKWAGHPAFKQVSLIPTVYTAFGEPQFREIFRAAAAHDLPVAIHNHARYGMWALAPVGFPSYYFDGRAFHGLIFAGHLVSLLTSGIFDEVPNLKVVFIEGGFMWLLLLMWRLDNLWRQQRSALPKLTRAPSEYIRDHIRLTTQPAEKPPKPLQYQQMLDDMQAEKILMFSSDYPHWDGDYVPDSVVRGLRPDLRERIPYLTACELYGLPRKYTVAEEAAR